MIDPTNSHPAVPGANTSDLVWTVLKFAAVPFVTAVLGAVIAIVRTPSERVRSMIQHFAAGVVFSVVGVELLPDVIREHRPVEVVIGFAIGVMAMLGVRSWTKRDEASDEPEAPAGLVAGVAIDLLIDGLLIGIGFAAGAKEGRLLTLALAVELLSLGLAVCVAIQRVGASPSRAVGAVAALASLLVLSAVGGATVLTGLSERALELVLSFGLAALLFLVTEELLVEAHENPETPLTTATFFAGFLLFLVLGMVA